MNKVYKIVFNKAKNCYMVVSEMAKGHTKSASSKKIVQIGVVGAVALSLVNGGVALAGQYQAGDGSSATANNTVAVGNSARSTTDNSVVVGNSSTAERGTNQILLGNNLGTRGSNYGEDNNSDVLLMGNGLSARDSVRKIIFIGHEKDNAGGEYTRVVDRSHFAIAIGSGNIVQGNQGTMNVPTAAGRKDVNNSSEYSVTVGNANTLTSAAESIVLGNRNTVGTNSYYGGGRTDRLSYRNVVLGNENRILGTNDSVYIGNNITKESSTNYIAYDVGIGYRANPGGVGSVVIGKEATSNGNFHVAIGSNSVANNDNDGKFGIGFGGTYKTDKRQVVQSYDTQGDNLPVHGGAAEKNTNSVRVFSVGGGTGADKVSTRRLVNVTAGYNDTDAVNMAQLRSVATNMISLTGDANTRTTKLALAVADSGNGDGIHAGQSDERLSFGIKGDGSYISTKADGSNVTISFNSAKLAQKSPTVLVDKTSDNEVVAQGADGKYYHIKDLNADGTPKQGAQEVPADNIEVANTNPELLKGTSTQANTPNAINGVEGALAPANLADKTTNNTTNPAITAREAITAVAGDDNAGDKGLYALKGKDLYKAVNTADLQAVAKAGANYTADNGNTTVNRPLGTSMGFVTGVDANGNSAYAPADEHANLGTIISSTNNNISFVMKKIPKFDGVDLGNAVQVRPTNGQFTLNNVKATGLADGTIAQGSTDAVTGGQIHALKHIITSTDNTIAVSNGGDIFASNVNLGIANGAITADKLAANAVTADKIAANAVTADKIAADAVTADKIQNGAVGADKLAANAVTADKIAANAVTADKIQNGAVGADKLAANAVTADKIAANAVTADKIAADAVTADKIQNGSVDANKLAANAVTADKIANGAVTADKLDPQLKSDLETAAQGVADGAVTTDKLANDAVTADKIQNGAVGADKLAANAVTADKIQNGAVTTDKLGAGAVTGEKIATGAVDADKLAADAVTADKIKDGAVGTNKLADSAVTSGKIADGAVTEDKLANNAVTGDKIAAGAVDTGKLANNAVTEDKLADDAVTENKIKDGAVTADKIANGAITADKIAPGAISAANIADADKFDITSNDITVGGAGKVLGANITLAIKANAITADKLADNAITPDKIQAGSITTDKLDVGAVTDEKLADDAVTEDKIKDGAVTEDKLGAGAVTEGKLANDAVTEDKIKAGAVTTDKLADGAVTADKIADNTITLDKLAADAVAPADKDEFVKPENANKLATVDGVKNFVADQALNFVADDTDAAAKIERKMGTTLKISAGNAITAANEAEYDTTNLGTKIDAQSGSITVMMKKELALKELTLGGNQDPAKNTKLGVDDEGNLVLNPKVPAAAGGPVTSDPARRILGVAQGKGDNDAVNVAQVNGMLSSINNKIDYINQGSAGNVVFTDEEGERVSQYKDPNGQTHFYHIKDIKDAGLRQVITIGPDGKENKVFYNKAEYDKFEENKANGTLPNPEPTPVDIVQALAGKDIPADKVTLSLVDSDGNTTTPEALSNVGSALKLPNMTVEKNPGDTPKDIADRVKASEGFSPVTTPEDADKARTAIAGADKDGKGGIYEVKGKDLYKATTLGDLQAVAAAGLTFQANDQVTDAKPAVHRPLGTAINIVGKTLTADEVNKIATDYSNANIATTVDADNNAIVINMKKTPEFAGVDLVKYDDAGAPTGQKINMTVGGDNGDTLLLSSGKEADGTNKPVALSGIKAGDVSEGSTDVANAGQLFELKQEVKDNIEKVANSTANLVKQVSTISEQANAGTASAMAAAGVPQILNTDSQHLVGVGVGSYHGARSLALGYTGTNRNRDIIYRVTGTYDSTKTFGVSAGVGFTFGKKTSYKNDEHLKENNFHAIIEAQREEIASLRSLNAKHEEEIETLKAQMVAVLEKVK